MYGKADEVRRLLELPLRAQGGTVERVLYGHTGLKLLVYGLELLVYEV